MTSDTAVDTTDEDLCVARVPLFKSLSREEQLEVAQMARPAELTKGRSFPSGPDGSQLVVVHAGRVKVTRIGPDGQEQILRVLGPGDFVGESAFLTGRFPEHVTIALEPGSACVFPHTALQQLVERHPSIAVRMLQGVSRRLEEIETRLAALISGDVTSRLAGYLLSLPARRGREGLEVELPLAKKDVASLLDTTPESLSRQLRRLHEAGVASSGDGRRVVIRDVDALVELSRLA